jgi:hypothetical protein
MRKFGLTAGLFALALGVAFVLLRLAGGAGIVPGNLFGGPTSIRAAPAKELPPRDPEAQGVVLRRADNSLIIGVNFTKYQRNKNDDTGEVWHEIAFDGKPLEKEVVVTRDTIIYGDATDMNAEVVNGKIQQIVRPGALDDIRKDAFLRVWGEVKGDRVIAKVLLYFYLPG